MTRVEPRTQDPIHYARVQAEQKALEAEYSSHITMARLCPYCKHKIEILCKGTHGASYVKCPQCREQVFFPPVVFRLAYSAN